MPLIVQLSDGTKNIDLIFDEAMQPNFSASYGYRIQQEETVVNRHRPDAGTPEPTSGYDLPSTLFLTMDVKGTADTRLNKIAELKRWVDGADQQALRYKVFKDVPKITLALSIPNATNSTTYDVRWGFVDDSLSYYTSMADINGRTRQVVVMVRLEPYGEGADIVLRNDLPSSPHMLEDSNGDGLADGLIEVGLGVAIIDLERWLIGGKSQHMAFTATNTQGFLSAAVPSTTSDDVVLFCWLTSPGGVAPIIIELQDGAGTAVTAKTFDPSNPSGYDQTVTGDDGSVWYRYSISHYTNRAAANVQLSVFNEGNDGSGDFWTDGWYLQVEPNFVSPPVPDSFASTASILNRNDPTAANPERINYVDTWGIPGDSLALAKWDLEGVVLSADGEPASYFAAVLRDGKALAADQQYIFEGEDGVRPFPGGSWNNIVDVTRSGGAYARIDFSGHIHFDVPTRFTLIPWRVFAIVRADSTLTTFELYDSPFAGQLSIISQPVPALSANRWGALDLGLINPVGQVVPGFDLATIAGNFGINVVNNGTNADIDFVFCIPAQTDESPMFMVTDDIESGVQTIGESLVINGRNRAAYISDIGRNIPTQNFLVTAQHGDKMQRTIFATHNDGAGILIDWPLDDNFLVTLTATPRTRQLLGTQ